MNYTYFLNPQVTQVPPSGIRRFFDLASTMKDTISLGVGEPDFVTPYTIRDAAVNAILDGGTQYTANRGLLELRREIALYLSSRFGTEYNPDTEILVTIGASEAIDATMRVLICPGDEVLIPDPSYVSYSPSVRFAYGVPVPVVTREENGFRLMPEDVEKAITPRTKLILLPYPNNPTGGIMEKEDLLKIADIVRRHDLMVISDEIYAELTYGGKTHVSFASLPGMWERTMTINGFSKAFAMTGWRVGYVCGPAEIISEINKIHQYGILCASRMSQEAAVAALKEGREKNYADVRHMRDSYDRRRRLLVEGFRNMGLSCFEPLGAFYVFPSIRVSGLDSEMFCQRLLMEQHIAAVPGTAFGVSGEGFIRCSYATALEKLSKALQGMERFLRSLPEHAEEH